MSNEDIVSRLWNLCNILRDDGITFHQYVNELTYLLFLKMAEETSSDLDLPKGFRWADLLKRTGEDQFQFYRRLLVVLGTRGSESVKAIFANPTSLLRHAESLNTLVAKINELDWYSAKKEGLGDLYEGLLEKNANEKKSGAGQYFTPRQLIDSMVRVMKPTLQDIIQDPAAGTGGFLIVANRYILEHSAPTKWSAAQQRKYRDNTFFGMEHVQDTHRLALMNLMLHGIDYQGSGAGIHYGNTLAKEGQALCERGATLILTNPPFGTKKGGGVPTRTDFTYPTSNKQLCFLQHIYRALLPGGRAAVVLPDSVLFEGNICTEIRRELMHKCNLHTILRLPTGIFYAQGVKTNVLFFTKGKKDTNNTKAVWIYDLRAKMPQFGKRTRLTQPHFVDFERAFGSDPLGESRRKDTGEMGRFRRFTRAFISQRDDNLDISWLRSEEDNANDDLPDSAVLAQSVLTELELAMDEIRTILEDLGERVEN
jgi:type I restriction enzyme M protein